MRRFMRCGTVIAADAPRLPGSVDLCCSATPCGWRTLALRHPQGVALHHGSLQKTKSTSLPGLGDGIEACTARHETAWGPWKSYGQHRPACYNDQRSVEPTNGIGEMGGITSVGVEERAEYLLLLETTCTDVLPDQLVHL